MGAKNVALLNAYTTQHISHSVTTFSKAAI